MSHGINLYFPVIFQRVNINVLEVVNSLLCNELLCFSMKSCFPATNVDYPTTTAKHWASHVLQNSFHSWNIIENPVDND